LKVSVRRGFGLSLVSSWVFVREEGVGLFEKPAMKPVSANDKHG
jgi:hypothetical protein